MPFNRVRYVTVCQQLLVTATVSAVGLTAAGVMTLDIVAPTPPTGAPMAGGPLAGDLAPAVRVQDGFQFGRVAARPVTPKVREVAVAPVAAKQPAAREAAPTTPDPAALGKQPSGEKLAALSAPEKVSGYATVGVTWAPGIRIAENAITVQVRTLKNGDWSGWQRAGYHDDHGPDADEVETAKERPGTDAIVIGDVDQVQMRALTPSGKAPADLKLAVIDPGAGDLVKAAPAIDTARLPAPASTSGAATSAAPIESTGNETKATPTGDIALSAMQVAPKPYIYSRAQWGANEAMRDASSLRYGTIQTGFIHHTVNANSYTADQVPSLLRGIYAYHTQSRGWSDIGYNFLVDRFGRIWEGRYGGVNNPVVGAHTLGYNEVSFAMSAIGNFDIASPPQAILNAYASLFAWKLSLYDIKADATGLVVKGTTLNAINGHRDVGQTACPGRYLYAKIPGIRVAAAAIQRAAQTGTPPTPTPTPTPPPAPAVYDPSATPKAASPQSPNISFPRSTNLSGSSWPDLALLDSSGNLSVASTGGQTGLLGPVASAGAWWKNFWSVTTVGDVTGDGRADVLGRTKTRGISKIYRGDGAGHFSTTGVAPSTAFAYTDLIAGVGDVNGDGRADVVGRDRQTGQTYLYRGTGKGAFAARTLISRGWTRPIQSLVSAGDLTGDGRTDLAAEGTDGRLYLIPGAAHGTFPKQTSRRMLGSTYSLAGGGEMTGDSRSDLALRDSNGKVFILPGRGSGTFSTALGPISGAAGLYNLAAAKVTGTSQVDLVGRNSAGRLLVLPNNGRTNIAAPVRLKQISPASALLNVDDWNRDGRDDLITRTGANGSQLWLYRQGAKGFVAPVSMGNLWGPVSDLAAVGDITGDGFPDLVGQVSGGTMTIFPGDGRKGFKPPQTAPYYLNTYNRVGGVATWHTREVPGTIISSQGGTFVPLTGSSPAVRMRQAGVSPASYDAMVGIGDVNGDSYPDLIAREKGTGVLWLFPGTYSGLGARVYIGSGFGGYQLVG